MSKSMVSFTIDHDVFEEFKLIVPSRERSKLIEDYIKAHINYKKKDFKINEETLDKDIKQTKAQLLELEKKRLLKEEEKRKEKEEYDRKVREGEIEFIDGSVRF